jgi:hypothetical protein
VFAVLVVFLTSLNLDFGCWRRDPRPRPTTRAFNGVKKTANTTHTASSRSRTTHRIAKVQNRRHIDVMRSAETPENRWSWPC